MSSIRNSWFFVLSAVLFGKTDKGLRENFKEQVNKYSDTKNCILASMCTWPHTANRTCDWIRCCALRFPLFGHLKKHLADKCFATDTDVNQAVIYWLNTFDMGFFHLVPRWDKCLSSNGDYVEVWCVPCATYVSYVHESQNTVLDISVTFFWNYLYLSSS